MEHGSGSRAFKKSGASCASKKAVCIKKGSSNQQANNSSRPVNGPPTCEKNGCKLAGNQLLSRNREGKHDLDLQPMSNVSSSLDRQQFKEPGFHLHTLHQLRLHVTLQVTANSSHQLCLNVVLMDHLCLHLCLNVMLWITLWMLQGSLHGSLFNLKGTPETHLSTKPQPCTPSAMSVRHNWNGVLRPPHLHVLNPLYLYGTIQVAEQLTSALSSCRNPSEPHLHILHQPFLYVRSQVDEHAHIRA
eukprot:1150903-Pelagomonas_calceolata.AAC.3